MKFSALVVLVSASIALASPAVVSLNRATKEVRDADSKTLQVPCIMCPCDKWDECRCIPNGCCCRDS
ncbi:hypothetical protein M011DRAFT_471177 [Sporormia fimetaria CBS 119925]|uniref:Uncharacterized protein n=1 Tax=Sporormia fimetaria CBS 119925 TaxID=1340428 RepID=A0A6A6V0T6_9PLEO|nr:hypothetical protein M011DRAFT_471177 [Sporormia fimetaria CBS 119925]